jgi:hypothetical protein
MANLPLKHTLSVSKIKEFGKRGATVDRSADTITTATSVVRKTVDRFTQALLIERGNLTIIDP